MEVALDIVGASNWPLCLGALKAGGRMVTFSLNGGRSPDLDIVDLLARQLSIMGAGGSGSKEVAAKVMSLVNLGRLRGHVDRVMGLHDAGEALVLLEQRQVIGKIVLDLD